MNSIPSPLGIRQVDMWLKPISHRKVIYTYTHTCPYTGSVHCIMVVVIVDEFR